MSASALRDVRGREDQQVDGRGLRRAGGVVTVPRSRSSQLHLSWGREATFQTVAQVALLKLLPLLAQGALFTIFRRVV